MSAATTPRNTLQIIAPIDIELPIKSGATLIVGCMANVDANGDLTNAADTASERCAGNVQSINAAGTKAIIRRGIFRYENGATITAASIGVNATVGDNQTVSLAASTTNDVVAGKIVHVDTAGVWVDHSFA